MALSKIDAANFLTGTIPQGNVANASLGAVTALPGAIPTGKVLQVVTANETANRSITSTSYVNSSNGLTVDITPSATSSKIFIAVSITKFKAPSGQAIFLTVYRDSSNIGGSSGLALNGGFNESIPASFSIMDSPSSTSSLTYQVYAKTSGGTSEYGDGSGISTITAFEIGA
jgi:hypothetical protein